MSEQFIAKDARHEVLDMVNPGINDKVLIEISRDEQKQIPPIKVDAISWNVTREMAPIYMFSAGVGPHLQSFSRGKRGIAGSLYLNQDLSQCYPNLWNESEFDINVSFDDGSGYILEGCEILQEGREDAREAGYPVSMYTFIARKLHMNIERPSIRIIGLQDIAKEVCVGVDI